MNRQLRMIVLGIVFLGGVGLAWAAAAAPATAVIPRQVLFGNPDRASLQVSPDGQQLAFLAPLDGVLNVWVAPLADPAKAKAVTHDTRRGIRGYFWAFTNEHILYVQDKDGDENWRVYSVNVKTDAVRDLTPATGVQARVQGVSYKFPHDILVALNDRNPQLHDIHRVNIETGEKKLLLENEGYVGFVTDDTYAVRFAMRITPDGGEEVLERTADGDWKSFTKIGQEDALTTGPAGFDKSGKVLYMTDSRGRNTAALTSYDLTTGKQTVLAEDPRADVADVMAKPVEKTIEAVGFTVERKNWKILDKAIEKDFATLRKVADGDFEVTSRSLDDKVWIVAYLQDDGPVRYYRYQRPSGKADFLFVNRPALEKLPLAKMHPVTIKSRDGMDLVCYLTLPVGSNPDGKPRPAQPVPLVLNVHGGPWGRDNWGYNAEHQWLANRGYAALSVNFRASTGLGKQFTNAGDREWGARMHDDLLDAVQWAIREHIADPKKVAIMGGSYGGYATLVGMTFTPDQFACGVDICGPSNLVTFMNAIPPYWQPVVDLFVKRIGDHRTEEGKKFLLERSPLMKVAQIQRPLLIGQGANDPRVKQEESDQIVQAMQAKQIPVTYVLFPDEGHGFARPENRLAFYGVAESFLAQHLGGRAEPIGQDFGGSSVSVPAGVDQVPGVAEALKQG
ncbi:MAG TPA: S9 family peptidase [Phycisphaerae bacterium]|nr:S9 family peptidase [Phycisphaerae bacterium]HNU44186.1 S9 family peptidase [Phycisphaerae bacterium]